jgi:hypothetical protein
MAQVNDQDRFGGPYMIQDHDHMSGIQETTDKAARGGVRQSQQSQPESRQQGGDDQGAKSQGEGRRQRLL